MSAVGTLMRQLMSLGVEGDALVEAVERCAAEFASEQSAEVVRVVEAASRRADEQLPPYDQEEHRRALGRARQAKLEEKRRQKASESVRTASDLTPPDAKEIAPTPPKENNPIPPLKGGTFPQISDAPQPEKPKPEVRAKPLSEWVSEIWEITPRPGRARSGRPVLETALRAAQRRGADLAAVRRGLESYYASPDATKDGGQFAQGVHVVVSSGRWEAFADDTPEGPLAEADPWRHRLVQWRVAQYWNSDWGPKPGKPGYEGPSEEIAA